MADMLDFLGHQSASFLSFPIPKTQRNDWSAVQLETPLTDVGLVATGFKRVCSMRSLQVNFLRVSFNFIETSTHCTRQTNMGFIFMHKLINYRLAVDYDQIEFQETVRSRKQII